MIEAVRESAEYHFLNMLDKIKPKSQGWFVLSFAFSRYLNHSKLVSDLSGIESSIAKVRLKADGFLGELLRTAPDFLPNLKQGYGYLFSDQDVVFLIQIDPKDTGALKQFYVQMVGKLEEKISRTGSLSSDIYGFQKYADQKILSAKRFEAYYAMCDSHKVGSIFVRRERREESRVLVVEDDRFTASYAAGALSKQYDVTLSRNGEEAISAYIDIAPDIVFLDIHLPGLSGHETLLAIKAVDPLAHIVMLSADTEANNVKKAAEQGAKNFLKKPFSKERLINTVRDSPFVRGTYTRPDG